jgi:hypothetical protein
MSRTQLDWIKSQFPESTVSNAGIFRCALATYVQHLERELDHDKDLCGALVQLKAARQATPAPWKNCPEFSLGAKLTTILREQGKERIYKLFRYKGFQRRAEAMEVV